MKIPKRLSIGGLMFITLVISIGLAALRLHTEAWAGGFYLLTYAILLLACVGTACRPAAERAWWLGFALFGIAYFRWRFSFGIFGYRTIELPTTRLLELIRPEDVGPLAKFGEDPSDYYYVAGQCLWSLLIGLIGATLSHALFSGSKIPATGPIHGRIEEVRLARFRWRRVGAVGMAVFLLLAALMWISPPSNLALWAGSFYIVTWILLGTLALGAACERGHRRMVYLGAALFGLGYMTLNRSADQFEQSSYVHLVADELLQAIRPNLREIVSGFPARTAAMAHENARLRRIFDRPIPMEFGVATPLEDVLSYVRTATQEPDGREIAIYVDPQALQDADKTLQSTIQLHLTHCPLSTSLTLVMQQVGLRFYIWDGLVYITSETGGNAPVEVDYYLLVGHSCLALLSAGLGAILVPFVSHRGD